MADPKVTLAQLRSAAKKAGYEHVAEEDLSGSRPAQWDVLIWEGREAISVWAIGKQRARKLALRVLKGMADE